MIQKLKIENFILIDEQELCFNSQLNVLTGDTGSGKSVIINSIKFVFGMRANSDLFLDQTKNIKVTVVLDLTEKLKARLDQFEIDYDDQVEVMRVLSPAGKNKIRINGELVSVSTLNQIFEDVITIYSQYSVAKFKTDSSYLQILDSLVDNNQLLADYQVEYNLYRKLQHELEELESKLLLKEEKKELLELRLNDLKQLNPELSIDQLIAEKKELDRHASNAEVNAKASSQFELASNALTELMQTVELDEHLKLLNDALINIDEVSFEIAKASEPVDEQRLNFITDYISTCRRLGRKYNVELENLHNFKEQLQIEFDNLDGLDADIANLNNKINKQYNVAYKLGQAISEQRQTVIAQFVLDVNHHLKQLSLNESDFRVLLTQDKLTKDGIDVCQFEIKMNSGGQYTLIHKTASGGEIARFLLALEAVCSTKSGDGFIIFDEIDTGVSGHVASEMANMMKQISKNNKLLIVTHLAQVASISQNHFMISKSTNGKYTTSTATLLTVDEKPTALAKMISGQELGDEAIAHAKTLLEQNGGLNVKNDD